MRCAKHSLYRLCCAFFSPKKGTGFFISTYNKNFYNGKT
ncbi:tetR family transcriptional regulator domain protein, partial [Acinetobacter baumannii 1440750]